MFFFGFVGLTSVTRVRCGGTRRRHRVAYGDLGSPGPTGETALAPDPVPSRTPHQGSVSLSDKRLPALLRLAPAAGFALTAARAACAS